MNLSRGPGSSSEAASDFWNSKNKNYSNNCNLGICVFILRLYQIKIPLQFSTTVKRSSKKRFGVRTEYCKQEILSYLMRYISLQRHIWEVRVPLSPRQIRKIGYKLWSLHLHAIESSLPFLCVNKFLKIEIAHDQWEPWGSKF